MWTSEQHSRTVCFILPHARRWQKNGLANTMFTNSTRHRCAQSLHRAAVVRICRCVVSLSAGKCMNPIFDYRPQAQTEYDDGFICSTIFSVCIAVVHILAFVLAANTAYIPYRKRSDEIVVNWLRCCRLSVRLCLCAHERIAMQSLGRTDRHSPTTIKFV